MTLEANLATVREFFATNDKTQGMQASLQQFGAEDFVAHFPGGLELSAEAMAGFGGGFYDACPGMRHDLEDAFGSGEQVAVRMVISGVHSRPFQMPNGPLPPSDRSFALPVVNIFRFEEGRIAELWAYFDNLSFLQRLGAIPE